MINTSDVLVLFRQEKFPNEPDIVEGLARIGRLIRIVKDVFPEAPQDDWGFHRTADVRAQLEILLLVAPLRKNREILVEFTWPSRCIRYSLSALGRFRDSATKHCYSMETLPSEADVIGWLSVVRGMYDSGSEGSIVAP